MPTSEQLIEASQKLVDHCENDERELVYVFAINTICDRLDHVADRLAIVCEERKRAQREFDDTFFSDSICDLIDAVNNIEKAVKTL
tara:strand:+ start:129 stop:386 length:258 start_codon:yes stop_codon:yes gene_type:complete